MIQDLFGSATLLGEEHRKFSIHADVFQTPPPTTTIAGPPVTTSHNPNLRCPRCDSSNTKFCYYNNYNLTQPRYFCKTCRRYWTKGGALRNVPIGGGCRKNKSTTTIQTSAGKSTLAGKLKNVASGSSAHFELPPNPILWDTPQNSHIFALLRGTQNPNPSTNPIQEPGVLDFDQLNNQMSFWRNSNQNPSHQNSMLMSEVQSASELYQRLNCQILNVSSSSSAIVESGPVSGGELGYWNPSLPWADLPTTTNGAYL